MFTLKLYQNGPLPPTGRTVVMEVAGIWVDHCADGVKHVQAFKKTVGVMDEDGPNDFYIGGEAPPEHANYYSWGVLENAQGKTTEMLR
jgi:hypothetical protein